MNQTEAWLYNKAKEADNEIELQDLYTIKFMFGGSWVMDLLEEYHKHQLTLTDVSHCFSNKEINIIRQWANFTLDSKKDEDLFSIEFKLMKKIHEKLNIKIESRIKKNCG